MPKFGMRVCVIFISGSNSNSTGGSVCTRVLLAVLQLKKKTKQFCNFLLFINYFVNCKPHVVGLQVHSIIYIAETPNSFVRLYM